MIKEIERHRLVFQVPPTRGISCLVDQLPLRQWGDSPPGVGFAEWWPRSRASQFAPPHSLPPGSTGILSTGTARYLKNTTQVLLQIKSKLLRVFICGI